MTRCAPSRSAHSGLIAAFYPRLARMILEADRLGCLREVLVITAALSIQDPRERPAEQQAQADQLHARFRDQTLGLPDLAEPVAPPARAAEGAGLQRLPADVPRGAPQLPAGARVAGLRVPAAPGGQADRAQASGAPGRRARTPTASTRRCCPGCSRHIGLRDRATGATTSAPAGRRFAIFPGLGAVQGAARLRDGRPSWSRPRGCGAGRTPRSTRSGPSGSAATWSSAPTPSRTGRRSARP